MIRRSGKSRGKGGNRKAAAHSENGAVIKKWSGRFSIALIFPDTYALGMSNIGFQYVYQCLNQEEMLVAERFFVPDKNRESAGNAPLWRSIESNRPLRDFDLVLFSISFETGYVNAARALVDAGITLMASERGRDEPLVIAGGVACQINPEPAALFMDAFLLGDFEELSRPFISFISWLAHSHDTTRPARLHLLKFLASSCPGTYVPQAYREIHDSKNLLTGWEVKPGFPEAIGPALFSGTPVQAPHTTIISPDAVFSDMSLIELARGCGRGCRFCSAGFIYRPPRPWPLQAINAAIDAMPEVQRIGMVGLEFLERRDIMELCETLLEKSLALAFSSLRADAITPRFVKLLKESGAKTATIAPEAGTERLRRIINKNLSEKDILNAAEIIARGGIPNIKCYFMTGLPFEQESDIAGIVSLVEKIRLIALEAGRQRGQLGTVTVSVSTFVPKAWTPFQWAPMASRREIAGKQAFLKKRLASIPNVNFRHDSWNSAFFQAVLSRGNRELAPVIEAMAKKNIPFKKAVMSCTVKTDKIFKGYGAGEILPWEIITHRVKKAYLLREWRHASQQKQTAFCDTTICRRCGACVAQPASRP